jgi:uncharacterized heparinase superfamily protein
LVGPNTFRFLNVERRCESGEDWDPRDATRLWTYNLHYFDDLTSDDAASRKAWHLSLMRRWVAQNPPGAGPGWEPYPVSRRIVNWVKWALTAGNTLPPECLASLATQSRWLMCRLEYHLMGNHLLSNAKALVCAGLFFEGAEADSWRREGLRILEKELREQILRDGGHFERSPMYHAATLEDLLDLWNLLRACGLEPPASWGGTLAKMRHWLSSMCHPDGDISFFNDAAFGVAPSRSEIELYCARLGLRPSCDAGWPSQVLHPSGYVRLAMGETSLICDCAPVGPDYLPGHAHADTLSFEMSIGKQRVFVNSGTSEYGTGVERQRQRGTAAHNTVTIDGQDSSEVWAGFRVAKRARARLHHVIDTPNSVTVQASHVGYRRLPGRNDHTRRWALDRQSLCIHDEISGTFESAVAYFHLHPSVRARLSNAREVTLSWPAGGAAHIVFEPAASVEVRPGTWHPRFGAAVENQCLVVCFSGPCLSTRVRFGTLQP